MDIRCIQPVLDEVKKVTEGSTLIVGGSDYEVTGFRNHYGQAEVVTRLNGKLSYFVLADVLRGAKGIRVKA